MTIEAHVLHDRDAQRGVYAVGHRALRRDASRMAAVLAAGPGAALSYRSAADFWGIRNATRARIDVSVPRRRRSTSWLEAAFNEAEYRRLSSPVSLDALLARHPGRRGTLAIRRVLAEHARYGETRTRRELERLLIALLDRHGLPRPIVNRNGPEGELDARWPEQRLVVECDGFAAHGTRTVFEHDRARDRALVVAGWRVVRITWRQLTDEPDTIARQLATLLEREG